MGVLAGELVVVDWFAGFEHAAQRELGHRPEARRGELARRSSHALSDRAPEHIGERLVDASDPQIAIEEGDSYRSAGKKSFEKDGRAPVGRRHR